MPFLKDRDNHFFNTAGPTRKSWLVCLFHTTNYAGPRSLAILLSILLLACHRSYGLDRQPAFLFCKTFSRRYYHLLLPVKGPITLVCRSRSICKVLIKLRKRRDKSFNKMVF